MKELRPHQADAIEMLRCSLLAGKKRPMVQAPTGFGKTLLAAKIVDGALRKGKRVLFVVPALSLIEQTVRAFADEGITCVGVMQGDHPMTDAGRPIQIASIQTLQRRDLPSANIVVLDEAHRWFDFVGHWMRRPDWRSIPFVGLSATPWTKGLGKFYDDLIVAATAKDLIEKGFLSPFRVFAPSHPRPDKRSHRRRGLSRGGPIRGDGPTGTGGGCGFYMARSRRGPTDPLLRGEPLTRTEAGGRISSPWRCDGLRRRRHAD